MPDMDGLEAARRINREFGDGRRPHLIALTANVYPSDQEMCKEAGMDDFLGKPLQLDRLQEVLLECRVATRASGGTKISKKTKRYTESGHGR